MTTYYETNLQHISEELKRIDLMIYQQVLKIRQKKEVVDGFQGLYISDEEINSILDKDTYKSCLVSKKLQDCENGWRGKP